MSHEHHGEHHPRPDHPEWRRGEVDDYPSTPHRSARAREWDVDGGVMRGLEWQAPAGSGVVLAAHGITANSTSWALTADRLPGFRILAPDLRGRGRSNHLPGPWSLARHADDLARVLDEEGIDRVVFAGHSMGAFVGMRFAQRHADRLDGLVLVDGGLPTPPVAPLPDGSLPSPEALLGPAVKRLSLTFGSREEYRDFWREHPAFGPWWNAAIEAYVDADLEPAPDGRFKPSTVPAAVLENLSELGGGNGYEDAFNNVRTPAAFIRSPKGLFDADPLYPEGYVDDWIARIPGLARIEADGTNHYTVVLSPHGADLTSAAIRGIGDVAVARARARAAHPATGRLRVIRPVD